MSDRNRWLDIVDRAGDQHIGETLVRLARLAVASHPTAEAESRKEDASRSQGRGAATTKVHDGHVAAAARTEASP